MKELIFEVAQEADGGFTAEAIGESIFTQADNWDELRSQRPEGGAGQLFRLCACCFDPSAPGSR